MGDRFCNGVGSNSKLRVNFPTFLCSYQPLQTRDKFCRNIHNSGCESAKCARKIEVIPVQSFKVAC
jgi:hypothetical protein